MNIQGNALRLSLKDKSVHCCVTSPPYWGLRDYGVNGQLGLERTPEEYMQNMVKVFREVKRVLRDDGTLWLNMGDCYAGSWGNYGGQNRGHGSQRDISIGSLPNVAWDGRERERPAASLPISGLKPKDLCGIPWRLAFALQADGWYLRSDIIWAKPNPMPESVTDRPTKAHEYIFLLTKSPHYFFDQEAVREKANPDTQRGKPVNSGIAEGNLFSGDRRQNYEKDRHIVTSRNIRSVWNIATQPFSGAHFATFPKELVRRCLLAGTSERGVCPKCGGPWVRMVEKIKAVPRTVISPHASVPGQNPHGSYTHERYDTQAEITTLGWRPSCKCGEERTGPAIVFDPFGGAGTTLLVATKLKRRCVSLDIKMEYIKIAGKRTTNLQVNLF